MPFSDESCVVSRGAEYISHAVGVLGLAGLHEVHENPGMGGITSGLDHPSVGSAERAAGDGIGEADSLASQTVDVGGRDVLSSVHPAHIGTELVVEYKKDVGFFSGDLPLTACDCQGSASRSRYLEKSPAIHTLFFHRPSPGFIDVETEVYFFDFIPLTDFLYSDLSIDSKRNPFSPVSHTSASTYSVMYSVYEGSKFPTMSKIS